MDVPFSGLDLILSKADKLQAPNTSRHIEEISFFLENDTTYLFVNV